MMVCLYCSDKRMHRLRVVCCDSEDKYTVRSHSIRESCFSSAHCSTDLFQDMTSLLWASRNGHLPVAELLISAKADVNAKNVRRI